MNTLKIAAPAKINLGLDVTGVRADGYHDVRLVMQSVALFDDILLEKTETSGITLTTDSPLLPGGESNLGWRAARALFDHCGIAPGVSIHIKKHIPIAAGLAGGSTDAAAVLLGCRALFAPDLSIETLLELASSIGADVPFCVQKGTMLAEGVGEKLTRLPDMPDCPIVLVKPPYGMETKEAYRRLDALEPYPHADIDGIIDALAKGDLASVAQRMGNVLEPVTGAEYPEIPEIIDTFLDAGALGSRMSGSGPSVFAIYKNEDDARKGMDKVKAAFSSCEFFLTKPLSCVSTANTL